MESAITSSFFLGALVSLVVITNPLTKIPLFLSLTEGWSSGRRRSEAAHAALDAFFIMVASLVAGNLLLSFFGISYGAMRIAGGFVVAVIGNQMLFGAKTPNDTDHGEKGNDGCAFFPLAMPGIAGPGTIAVVIGFSTQIAEADGLQTKAAMFAAVTAAAADASGYSVAGSGSVRHPGPHQNHGFSSYFDRYSVRGIRNSYLLPKVTGGRFSGTSFSQINLA